MGRIFSLVNVAVVGVTALSTGMTGWLAEYVEIRVIFGVFGLVGMTCGLVGWMYRPLREG